MRDEAVFNVKRELQRTTNALSVVEGERDRIRKEQKDANVRVYAGMASAAVAGRHTAALKRASLDLTRALAEMRKP